MSYETDARFVQGVILGTVDALGDDVLARLVVLQAKYRALQDAGMGDILRRAFDARASALASAQEDADRDFLNGMINGTVDLLSQTVFPRMEPMFDRYAEGSEMFGLLEKASIAFGDAAERHLAWGMAGIIIQQAQRGDEE